MGEKERGTSNAAESTTPNSPTQLNPQIEPLIQRTTPNPPPVVRMVQATPTVARPLMNAPTSGNALVNGNGDGHGPTGWSGGWRQLLWEKWRWGVVLALALVVSRLSSA